MSVSRFVLGLAVGLFCATPPASAILIEVDGARVGGFLKEDDGTRLRIGRTPDPQEKGKEYVRAKATIIHQLDVKVLDALSRDNAEGYYEYADKLARQEGDPEAAYVARRLYLIAAFLKPEKYGSGSLLNMSKLADTPAEARKCRALAYLLDPKAGPEFLKEAVKPAERVRPDKAQARALRDFAEALQDYRVGRLRPAVETAKHDGVDKIFEMAKLDRGKFLQWCEDANCPKCPAKKGLLAGEVVCPTCNGKGGSFDALGRLLAVCKTCDRKGKVKCPDCRGWHVLEPRPDDALRVVLRAELWALEQDGAGDDAGETDTAGPKGWSAVLQSGQPRPVLPLSLETITDFDPRKCRYRNGKWVE